MSPQTHFPRKSCPARQDILSAPGPSISISVCKLCMLKLSSQPARMHFPSVHTQLHGQIIKRYVQDMFSKGSTGILVQPDILSQKKLSSRIEFSRKICHVCPRHIFLQTNFPTTSVLLYRGVSFSGQKFHSTIKDVATQIKFHCQFTFYRHFVLLDELQWEILAIQFETAKSAKLSPIKTYPLYHDICQLTTSTTDFMLEMFLLYRLLLIIPQQQLVC